MGNVKPILSVKKAFDILDLLALEDYRENGMSLKELSEKLAIKPNTLYGILATMQQCGYVQKNSRALYTIGRRCRQIGLMNRLRHRSDTSGILAVLMKRLCHATGEGVSFYVLDNGERINFMNFQSNAIVRVEYTMLDDNSIYDYPSGKQLVAFCGEEELKKILKKHGYPREHWNGIGTRKELDAELARIRTQRILKQTSVDGTTSYSIAVFARGELFGTLGVYMPTFRLTEEKETFIRHEMIKTAEEIERSL